MPPKFDLDKLPDSPDLSWEIPLWKNKVKRVAGIDEVGRGAIAGPVAAAVLLLPLDYNLGTELDGVNDSKKMTSNARDHWARILK